MHRNKKCPYKRKQLRFQSPEKEAQHLEIESYVKLKDKKHKGDTSSNASSREDRQSCQSESGETCFATPFLPVHGHNRYIPRSRWVSNSLGGGGSEISSSRGSGNLYGKDFESPSTSRTVSVSSSCHTSSSYERYLADISSAHVSSSTSVNKAPASNRKLSVSGRDVSPTLSADTHVGCSSSEINQPTFDEISDETTRQNVEETENYPRAGKRQDLFPNTPSYNQECNRYEEKSNLDDDVSRNVFMMNEDDVIVSKESKIIEMNPSLRQFDLLDELGESDHEEGEIVGSNSDVSESDLEELPTDDVDAMLEEGLPDKFKSSNNTEHRIKMRRKIVLEEIGHDHFELLPEGWIQIMHSSGMPVYLHKKSRVCTMARPYYLGPGSSRNHDVPLSAIPCLQYRRASEAEKKLKEEREKKKQSLNQQSQSDIELMTAEIETFEENKATQSLPAPELNEYCKKVFSFRTINLVPFKSWADRRKYIKMTKDVQKKQRPTLPGGTKLLKFPIQNPDGTVSRSKGEWIINPNGKSYVCILHEYVQRALKKHPKYQFKELENPATPYSATVFIEEMKYGFGMGASKKQAKVEAAKAALEVLIPGMKDKLERDGQFGMRSGITKRSEDDDISIFDQIKVEDPRVAEFCTKTSEPPPYAILLTCLSRNAGIGEIKFDYAMNPKSFKQDEFKMTVGNHKATVSCKNKREGKQRAAQAILQALHPNITYWGSLLRMYGNRSIKNIKEKKQEEQEITELQSKASLNQPNYAILDKLKTELMKLKNKRTAIKAKGTFILPNDIMLPSLSSTDLNKVNLGL